jgi:hypothetical protein
MVIENQKRAALRQAQSDTLFIVHQTKFICHTETIEVCHPSTGLPDCKQARDDNFFDNPDNYRKPDFIFK